MIWRTRLQRAVYVGGTQAAQRAHLFAAVGFVAVGAAAPVASLGQDGGVQPQAAAWAQSACQHTSFVVTGGPQKSWP